MTDISPPLPPLTLSSEEMKKMGEKVFGFIHSHFTKLPDLQVTTPATYADLTKHLREPLPRQPSSPESVLTQFTDYAYNCMSHFDHPRNFAFIPGPSNFVSAMADAISSALNVFSGGWIGPSGIAQIELTTIDWLRQIFGFPEGSGGLFVSGGSMANLTGLAVARHVKQATSPDFRIYFSDQTHSSVAKGLYTLGFLPEQIRKLATASDGKLPLAALSEAVTSDRAAGFTPFCVVANAGTTNAGTVDPLTDMAAFCKRENLWMHVDAAFGGGAMLSEKGRAALCGIEQADSLTIDPHKWLFQPYEVGCSLVRNRDHLRDTFQVTAEYLKILEQSAEQINFFDYGVQLTRGFRALKVWMSFKVFGMEAFSKAVDIGFRHAEYVESLLKQDSCWEIITPAQLGIITFRYTQPGYAEERLNRVNDTAVRALIDSGFAMLSPTIMSDKHVMRLCLINPRTTENDITRTLSMLKELAVEAAKD